MNSSDNNRFRYKRDPLPSILSLIVVLISWVGISKPDMNFPDTRVSPIVPVSNRAFALCLLTYHRL